MDTMEMNGSPAVLPMMMPRRASTTTSTTASTSYMDEQEEHEQHEQKMTTEPASVSGEFLHYHINISNPSQRKSVNAAAISSTSSRRSKSHIAPNSKSNGKHKNKKKGSKGQQPVRSASVPRKLISNSRPSPLSLSVHGSPSSSPTKLSMATQTGTAATLQTLPTTNGNKPLKSSLKSKNNTSNKKKKIPNSTAVIFDDITIIEFPIILGDHPAVSSGAPVTIGWEPCNKSVVDLDFYEYCKTSKRKRRRPVLSVRKRANVLLGAGYSIEQIARATLQVERVKKERTDSLKATGWSNYMQFLNGAVETTGTILKGATRKSFRGMTDITTATGKLLASGVQGSSRAVTGVAGGVVKAGTIVTAPVVGGAKKVGKTANKMVTTTVKVGTKATALTVTTTGKAVTGIAKTTGRVLAVAVSPITGLAVIANGGNSNDTNTNTNNNDNALIINKQKAAIMAAAVASQKQKKLQEERQIQCVGDPARQLFENRIHSDALLLDATTSTTSTSNDTVTSAPAIEI